MSPQLALAGGDRRDVRAGDVRDPVLPPVVPAGAVGQPVRERGQRELRARRRDRRAARRDPRLERPDPGLEPAGLRGRDLAAQPAGPAHRSEPRAPAPAGCRAVRPARRASLGLPTKRQPCPVDGHGLLQHVPDRLPVVQGYVQLPYGEATVAHRHHHPAALVPLRAPGLVPGRERPADLPADLPVRATSRRSCSGSSAGSPPREVRPALLRGRVAERLGRPVGARGLLRPLPPRASTAPRRSRSTRSATSTGYLSQTAPIAGRQPQAVAQRASSRRSASRRSSSRSTRTTRPTAARSWR